MEKEKGDYMARRINSVTISEIELMIQRQMDIMRQEFREDRKESEARLAADRADAEARLAAERVAAEARLAVDRKDAEARQQAAEARLAAERKDFEAKFEAERKDFEAKFEAERKEARSTKRWLIGNFVAVLALAAGVIVALINGF